ncbi:MAG TPA: efflux RND transporter periplasmic adaptor subunit [Terracidiphilus sp.]|nr:efflux RND transporter periplasmic adaptor subunit [Terracidiphilus sp.]
MKTSSYRIAFGATAMLCVVLAAAVVYLLASRNNAGLAHAGQMAADPAQEPVIAKGPSAGSQRADQTPSAAGVSEPTLAPVQLSPQRMQEIGVTTAVAAMKTLSNDLQVPGNVEINEEKLAYVQTRFQGWIQRVFANATYQYVQKGQPLFTVYSPDLVSSEQEYLLARKNQAAFSQPMHSDSMTGMAHQEPHQENGWLVQAATQRLEQFGMAPEEIADLEKTGKEKKDATVYSPVSGYITERNALPNAYVQPETKLYTIADLSTVWVYANVFQNDVGRLRPGDRAKVTLDAYPGKTFSGRLDQILPQVDQTTRTVRVRLVMANPGLALKPGMYVNVDIAADLGRQLVVPASAVLHSGQRAVAFIDRGEGNLEPRTVTTGPQIDGDIIILSGLKAGDRVISSANFLIDSEAQLQSASQSFAPAATGTAPNTAASAEKVSIDFSSNPSPPRTGSNAMRVKLTGPDGKAVSGAQVTLTIFMPAMPEMGMAAMHATASLSDQGGGNYEGRLDVPMAGTWQATVSVMRSGQVIATKRMSVTAGGGM